MLVYQEGISQDLPTMQAAVVRRHDEARVDWRQNLATWTYLDDGTMTTMRTKGDG